MKAADLLKSQSVKKVKENYAIEQGGALQKSGLEVKESKRESAVELLKIIAMFLIVISHVAQTLSSRHLNLSIPAEVFFDASFSTTDLNHFLVLLMRHFGALGNVVFFICSAWFLCGKKSSRAMRILEILLNVWILSVLSLAVSAACGFFPPKKEIIKLFFPTTFEFNWYTTCYVLFLAFCPSLNVIIENSSRKSLSRICVFLCAVYCGICCVAQRFFYGGQLMFFIAIYFFVAYVKIYLPKLTKNLRLNAIILVLSLALLFAQISITNFLRFKIPFFGRNALHWARNNNPLIILAAFSAFNLFRSKAFYSRTVNYISSLTLFIYLIHEGFLFREYVRPKIWAALHEKFGYSHMIFLVIVFSVLLFAVSVILSAAYKETLSKIARKISRKVFAGKDSND